jgi:hypothetical protein
MKQSYVRKNVELREDYNPPKNNPDVYTEIHKHLYSISLPQMITDNLIESAVDSYLSLSQEWSNIIHSNSFFNYLVKQTKYDKRFLAKFLESLDSKKELPSCTHVFDETNSDSFFVFDTIFFPYLKNIIPRNPGLARKITEITLSKRLAQLVAQCIVKKPEEYLEAQNLQEMCGSFGPDYGGRLYRLYTCVAYWNVILDKWREEGKYKSLVDLLPRELRETKNDEDFFLTLLPVDLRRDMEFIIKKPKESIQIIKSKYLHKEEKVNILLKIPEFSGYTESELMERIPRLNLGMIKFDETKKMGLEVPEEDLLNLAVQISPFLSREELIEFFSKKLTEIYIRDKGFQVNREKASVLIEKLEGTLSAINVSSK